MLKTVVFSEFVNQIKQKRKLVVWGIGKRFWEYLADWEPLFEQCSELYLVDNSPSKAGEEVTLAGRRIVIQPFDRIKNLLNEEFMIFVTVDQYLSVLDMLSEEPCYQTTDVYVRRHFDQVLVEEFALSREMPRKLRLTDEPMIPKVIHYFWCGGAPLPDRYKRWMESWQKYCPDYEIKEWNESNYDFSKIPYMKQAYEHKKWGFVPDYARLDVVYQYGGLYFDTDVEIVKPLDDLLYQPAFAGFERLGYVNFGQGFGAAPKHPMIKALRDEYNDAVFVREDGSYTMDVASPMYQTRVLERAGLVNNGEYQIVNGMTIYPEKMLCAKSIYTMRVREAKYTHTIHHFDGSWAEPVSRETNQKVGMYMTSALQFMK